jgi:FkbM family methyltransferase
MNDQYMFDIREGYPTDEVVVREIWEENVYEVHGWHFDKSGVAIDIGANIGAFSIYAAAIGAKKIYAIEPEPNNLEALKANISLNVLSDKIEVLDIGVSDFNGTALITNEGGGSSIFEGKGTEIDIVTLDNLFKMHQIDYADFIKIDTEGSEVATILGASKETMQKCGYLAIEFDSRTRKKLGDMVVKLSETHHTRTMGSWERGGMIWAWLY